MANELTGKEKWGSVKHILPPAIGILDRDAKVLVESVDKVTRTLKVLARFGGSDAPGSPPVYFRAYFAALR